MNWKWCSFWASKRGLDTGLRRLPNVTCFQGVEGWIDTDLIAKRLLLGCFWHPCLFYGPVHFHVDLWTLSGTWIVEQSTVDERRENFTSLKETSRKENEGRRKENFWKDSVCFVFFFSLPRKERKKERNQLWVNIVYWNCFVGKLAKARKSLWRRPRLLHHVINGPLCFADRFDS